MKNLALISIFIFLTNILNASENHDHDHDSSHKHENKHKMIKAEKPYPTLSFELFMFDSISWLLCKWFYITTLRISFIQIIIITTVNNNTLSKLNSSILIFLFNIYYKK